MKLISIDNRLKEIASLIDNCKSFADIGTDHGYLPIYLIQTNKAEYGYACDVAKMPLNSARENISKYNLDNKISTILSDGLKKVPKVDVVIMAGMGGNLIVDILKNAKLKYDTYILQPNINVSYVREYLTNNNYMIIDEKITFTHKKFYEILKVVKGNQPLTDLQIKYGPINLKNKSQIFIDKYTKILHKYESILSDFKGNEDDKNKIINEINELKNILN